MGHVGENIRGGGEVMALCEGGVGWPWSGGGQLCYKLYMTR